MSLPTVSAVSNEPFIKFYQEFYLSAMGIYNNLPREVDVSTSSFVSRNFRSTGNGSGNHSQIVRIHVRYYSFSDVTFHLHPNFNGLKKACKEFGDIFQTSLRCISLLRNHKLCKLPRNFLVKFLTDFVRSYSRREISLQVPKL